MMRVMLGIAFLGFLALVFILTFSVLTPAAAEPTPTAGITALPFYADATSTPTPTASPTPTPTMT
jgi:hypothetical protein